MRPVEQRCRRQRQTKHLQEENQLRNHHHHHRFLSFSWILPQSVCQQCFLQVKRGRYRYNSPILCTNWKVASPVWFLLDTQCRGFTDRIELCGGQSICIHVMRLRTTCPTPDSSNLEILHFDQCFSIFNLLLVLLKQKLRAKDDMLVNNDDRSQVYNHGNINEWFLDLRLETKGGREEGLPERERWGTQEDAILEM